MLEKIPNFFGNTRFFVKAATVSDMHLSRFRIRSLHPIYGGEQCYIWDAVKKMGAKKVFILFGLNDISIWAFRALRTTMPKSFRIFAAKAPKSVDLRYQCNVYVQRQRARS